MGAKPGTKQDVQRKADKSHDYHGHLVKNNEINGQNEQISGENATYGIEI